MLDAEELLFTITDLKQYIYCPRIFYYHACLPNIRPVTYKMKAGIDAHEDERKRALRRSFTMYDLPSGKRHFDVSVQSTALNLSGEIDEVVETDAGELIPVDYLDNATWLNRACLTDLCAVKIGLKLVSAR